MNDKMTIDQAIRILDPATSKAEIEKIRASIITDNDEDRYYVTIAKVDEACEFACEIMRRWQRQENDRTLNGILTKENLQKWIEECEKLSGKPEEVIEIMNMYGEVYETNG